MNMIKCIIRVGQSFQSFEVPDDLLTIPWTDKAQNEAEIQVAAAFAKCYKQEIDRNANEASST